MEENNDDLLINAAFEDLLKYCTHIFSKSSDNEKLIIQAFEFAKEAHRMTRRRSGEPFIVHSIAVAKIVAKEIGLGAKSVISALLHDAINGTDYTLEDIDRKFGPKIASMVDGLTKLSGIVESNDVTEQAANFRQIVLSISDDIRVVIIKIADRLNNMRTLQYLPPQKQTKVISETLYLYAPLAHRLGLYSIKTELEDLSLKYLHPNEYSYIQRKIEESTSNRNDIVENFIQPIKRRIDNAGINYKITSRVKSIYSIWNKMNVKGIPFDEVFDLFAIRIIFQPSDSQSERDQCFSIYRMLLREYQQKEDRLRNWVDKPKSNGYEALHCTLMDTRSHHWIEVQIRSERMDSLAELGFAAHWSYKVNETIKSDSKDVEFEKWLSQLRETLNDPDKSKNAVEFLEMFEQHLQVTSMTVFTPKGEPKAMPRGATALDFAYEIHSNVGNHAIGAKINYKLETLYTVLHPGDQVQIITSDTGSPKEEWLSHVITPKAKNRIKTYISQANESKIQSGKNQFEKFMADKSINLQGRLFVKLLPAFGLQSKESLYIGIADGLISKEQIYTALRSSTSTKSVKYWTLKILSLGSYSGNSSIEPGSSLVIADCCNPIPGDDVVGFMRNGVVTVHRKDCPDAIRLSIQHSQDIVDVCWSGEKLMSYLAEVEFNGIDRSGVVMDLAKIMVAELNINMRDIEIHSHDGIYEGRVSFYVPDYVTLEKVMSKLSKIRGMEKVYRPQKNID